MMRRLPSTQASASLSIRPSSRGLIVGLLLCAAWLRGPAAAQSSGDDEYEPGITLEPKVGMAADGSFIIVWNDRTHVYAQRYAGSGAPQGAAIIVDQDVPVNAPPPFEFSGQALSVAPGGAFVVAWDSCCGVRESHVRLFAKDGTSVVAHSYTNALLPSVSMLPDGSFYLAHAAIGLQAIAVRRFDSQGQPAEGGNPVAVVDTRGSFGNSSIVAIDAERFALAYERSDDIWVTAYDGPTQGFRAQVSIGGDSLNASIARGPAGTLVVSWEDREHLWLGGSEFHGKRVRICVLDSVGNILLLPLLVNRIRSSADAAPRVVVDDEGSIVVVYAAYEGARLSIFSMRYDIQGGIFKAPLVRDDAVWVNSGILPDQTSKHPSVAVEPESRRCVVAWESFFFSQTGEFDRSEVEFRVLTWEGDSDADTVADGQDNCPDAYNPAQGNVDGDKVGDACDDDADGDAIPNAQDNCPLLASADQTDSDNDGVGDACDDCPSMPDIGQEDYDLDGTGDACDFCWNDDGNDPDGDQLCSGVDNCPGISNPTQVDRDADGVGDACDNCPFAPNPLQEDSNANGVGDQCEPFLRGDSERGGTVDISDPIYTLNYLFLGSPPLCRDAMDSNDDGAVNITDAIHTLNFLFLGGPVIPPPYPDPGPDPTRDSLGCEAVAG